MTLQMTEQQQAQIKKLVYEISRELAQGYDYDVLPDPAFIQEATAGDVIGNLTDALAALQRYPGRA
jgi:hypothetical protein